jgi:hypothetical protein
MKKTLFLLLILFSVQAFSQKKKVAVTTFYVDKHIDFSGLDGAARMAASIASLAENPNFDLKSVLNNFHTVFFNDYAKQFPFDLMAEESVIGKDQYKNYESKFGETADADKSKLMQKYIVQDGYKPLMETLAKKEKRNEIRMLEIFKNDADGVMFVYMSYSFVKKFAVGGTGTAGIRAHAHIKLWNKEGKKVFSINESAVSDKTVAMVNGIPLTTPDKILPLCEDASQVLLKDLNKRLEKIAKKSAKKL